MQISTILGTLNIKTMEREREVMKAEDENITEILPTTIIIKTTIAMIVCKHITFICTLLKAL